MRREKKSGLVLGLSLAVLGGGSSVSGQTKAVPVRYSPPAETVFSDSPRYYWQKYWGDEISSACPRVVVESGNSTWIYDAMPPTWGRVPGKRPVGRSGDVLVLIDSRMQLTGLSMCTAQTWPITVQSRHPTTITEITFRRDGFGVAVVGSNHPSARGLGILSSQDFRTFPVVSTPTPLMGLTVLEEPRKSESAGKPYIFAVGYTQAAGFELWGSDGRTISQIKDINPGSASTFLSSPPYHLFAWKDRILFPAKGPNGTGTELWSSDGTAAGTQLVKDIQVGTASSFPRNFVASGAYVYFLARIRSTWWLHRTDGTTAGTIPLAPQASNRISMVDLDGTLVFGGLRGLWISDGSVAGTKAIYRTNLTEFAKNLERVGHGLVYFAGAGELWKTDGTAAGTKLVQDLRPGRLTSDPYDFVISGGQLYFIATHETLGRVLWRLPDPCANAKPFGRSCPRPGPWMMAEDPTLGTNVRIYGGGAPINTVGVTLLGKRAAKPIDLGRGCMSYLDPTAFIVHTAFVATKETWRYDLPIPNEASLRGAYVAAQTWFLSLTSPIEITNGVGLHVSR